MAAKKQPMGTKKSRTGGAMMPKKGAVKGAPKVGKKTVPPMPKGGSAGPYMGGGVSRSGGGDY